MGETADTQPAKQSRPFLFPSRIILFAVLGVLVIGEIVDLSARRSASAAFEAIQSAIGPENRNEVSRAKVHEMIGREPDADRDAADRFETYSWRGALRTQSVYVVYRDGDSALVEEVRRNEKPPGFEEPTRILAPPSTEEESQSATTPGTGDEEPANATPADDKPASTEPASP
jgi:hypothetical protein